MTHKKSLRSDLWQARCALLGILILQWLVQSELHLAGRRIWVVTVLELLLLMALTITSEVHVSRAQVVHDTHLQFTPMQAGSVRLIALTLFGCVSLINLAGLMRLIASLLLTSGPAAQVLLADALNLFATNVIIFALWYWELDRGGPYRRSSLHACTADFLFPQMTLDGSALERYGLKFWRPRFMDYLYVAFTNATAFSPTDTLPVSRMAKVLMMVQAAVSLMTIAIVAARAVNILK